MEVACDLCVVQSRRGFCEGRRTFGQVCDMGLMRGLGVIFGGGVFVFVSKTNFVDFWCVCLFF